MMRVKRKSESKQVFKNIKNGIKNMTIQVGWFDATYDNEEKTPVVQVAMIQEFGNPEKHIPPRPFMRPAKMEHEHEWGEFFAKAAKQVHKGRKTEEEVLNELGDRVIADIRASILKVWSPPLKEETLKRRRRRGNFSTKPLIDTKHMFDTLDKRIKKGDK